MSEPPIRSLFVTLRRSFAGTREHHVRIVKALGLRWRQQTVKRPNTPTVRGAIDKIKHLVSVETDQEHTGRMDREASAAAPKPPLHIQHTRQ